MNTALLWAHRLANPLRDTTGIGRYVIELSRALHADERDWSVVLGSRSERDPAVPDPSDPPVKTLPGPRAAIALSWLAFGWPPVERCGLDPDIVHVLNVSFPVPSHAAAVYTLHDLMILTHPEWYGRGEVFAHKRALAYARKHAAGFIAVSHFVADAAAERLDIDRARIHVVGHGVGDDYRRTVAQDDVARACMRAGVRPGHYVIALGSMTPRKNLSMLVRAFAAAGSSLDDIDLLLAGPRREAASRLAADAASAGVASRVHVQGFVDDADLPALLKGAVALAHPSLDEGFGLPPLEAMAVGTPTVVSTAGSLPEVVGTASVLVDPRDEAAWTAALGRLAGDGRERERLVAEGLSRSAPFTWSRAATETRAVWDRVREGRDR